MTTLQQEKSLKSVYDLTGKSAVVTGGAKGIGRAIAHRLAEAGASVMISDIAREAAAETAESLRQYGNRVGVSFNDMSVPASAAALIDTAVEEHGSVDILVNNAGIFPMKPALEMSELEWDRVLDLNLKGTFFAAQAAAKAMANAGNGGAIVNIASIDAFKPTGNLAHYDASKAGVVMLTKALAVEFGKHGIRVNAIAPGGINTDGTRSSVNLASISEAEMLAMQTQMMSRLPLGRMGEPDDIACAVTFLASDAARYMTGSTVVVDGGMLLI